MAVIVLAGCRGRSTPIPADIPRLIEDLRGGDDVARADAAASLGTLGSEGRTAEPALMLALRDESELVREKALAALIAIGPTESMIPALVDCLRDSDLKMRAQAAIALGEIGPSARSAIPGLIRALRDHDESVRTQASEALDQIDPTRRSAGSE